MNERIRLLYEQAHSIRHHDGDPMRGGNPPTVYWEGETSAEKFAELIVEECMTMCDETRADYFKHRKAADDFTDKNIYAEGESASDIIKYKMKKHFGVEE